MRAPRDDSPAQNPQAMEHYKHGLDAAALSASVLSFLGVLQPILAVVATALSIAWCCVQFYDRRQRKLAEEHSVKE